MILANSSAGLYDFRNELVQALLQEHKVVVSLPDEVKTKELEEEGCEVVRTQLSRRGTNPVKDLALPASTTLGGMVRGGKAYLINGMTQLEKGDIVVAFCTDNSLKRLEKYFK